MLNFIRVHPWRLEIAPAIAAAVAFGSILCYRYSDFAWSLEQIARAEGLQGLPRLGLAAAFGVLLLLWLNEIAWNHTWVIAERKQRINWVAPLMQAAIIAQALIIFEVARISVRLSMSLATPQLEWLMLTILFVSGIIATLLLELTRERVKLDEPEETTLPEEAVSAIPYTETEMNPYLVITGLGVVAMGALPLIYDAPAGWIGLVVGLIGALILVSLSRRKVTVTEEAITISSGLMRKKVILSDIESCIPAHHEPLTRYPRSNDKKKPKTFFVTTGKCLRVETKSRDVYLFGMIRPRHACGLIHHLGLVPRESVGSQSV